MSYATEFPDFGALPPQIAARLAAGELVDLSWHHDACPSFIRACDEPTVDREGSTDAVPVLWVNYADPAKRDGASSDKRFLITAAAFTTTKAYSETDDETEALTRLFHP